VEIQNNRKKRSIPAPPPLDILGGAGRTPDPADGTAPSCKKFEMNMSTRMKIIQNLKGTSK
jgi:hypothetical protein